jgi:hypothetical protein
MKATTIACSFCLFALTATATSGIEIRVSPVPPTATAALSTRLNPDHQYRVSCRLVRTATDGKESVISSPVLAVTDATPASIMIGSQVPLIIASKQTNEMVKSSHADGTFDQVTRNRISVLFKGTVGTVSVYHEREGRAKLDAQIEISDFNVSENQDAQVFKQSVRVVRSVELGEKVSVLLDKGDKGDNQTRVEFTVEPLKAEAKGLPAVRRPTRVRPASLLEHWFGK